MGCSTPHVSVTAVCFWPGSEAEIRGIRPSIYLAYNETVPFAERVETAVNWFVEDHKDFVALYFHEPDFTGHSYGPDSPEAVSYTHLTLPTKLSV